MKKSNILLLAAFLTVLLLLTVIHVSLYAKYKSGDYTVYNVKEHEKKLPMQDYEGIRQVIMTDVRGLKLSFDEKARVVKGISDDIRFVQKGHVLEVTGKPGIYAQDGGYNVTVYLPYSVQLSLSNTTIVIEGNGTTIANNPVIRLDKKASVLFWGGSAPLRLGQVQVVASDSSKASFMGASNVDVLDVRLSDAAIEYNNGDVNRLSILTDSVSRISLSTKLLFKANIKITQ